MYLGYLADIEFDPETKSYQDLIYDLCRMTKEDKNKSFEKPISTQDKNKGLKVSFILYCNKVYGTVIPEYLEKLKSYYIEEEEVSYMRKGFQEPWVVAMEFNIVIPANFFSIAY